MIDQYAELRAALDVEPISDDWIGASYGPKTVGVGISGGPALLMVRPSECIDHGDMRRFLHGFIMSRRHARALLAERDQYARVLDGLPQDAIGGGWTAKGASAYAKGLEVERDALRGHLAELIAICEPNLYPCPDKPNSKWAKLVAAKAALTQQEQV